MDKKILSTDGQETRTITLDDTVFNHEVSESTIYHAIRNELANRRQGTASTKTRGEVRGSRRKLWRQKGTGRARMGTRQSPIWVGGGIAFGPKPRDYSYKLPRKLKRHAFRSVLSLKAGNGSLLVVEDFEAQDGKTRHLVSILRNLIPEERAVFVVKNSDKLIKRAGRNIPWLTILSYNRLLVHDLFYGKKVLILESAVHELNEFYGIKDGDRRNFKKTSDVKSEIQGMKNKDLQPPVSMNELEKTAGITDENR